jgi:hypothetical protein
LAPFLKIEVSHSAIIICRGLADPASSNLKESAQNISRPKANHTCHQKPNLSRETIPLMLELNSAQIRVMVKQRTIQTIKPRED